jgi:methionine aminopeptidase
MDLFKDANEKCKKILKSILIQDLYTCRGELLKSSNDILHNELKNQDIFSIGYPVCISLNNELEFFCDYTDTTILKTNDLIKIEFALSFCYKKKTHYFTFGKTIDKLTDKIHGDLIKTFNKNPLQEQDDEDETYTITNDEVQMRIYDIYSKRKVQPILNNVSYAQMNGVLHDPDSKYIKINYKRESDEIKENYCFDLENGDVYSLSLFFTKNENEINPKIKSTHLYCLNKNFVPLRLKMQKQSFSNLNKEYNNNVFNSTNLPENVKDYGLRSLMDTGVLNEFSCTTVKENVYMIKTVLMVKNDTLYLF